MNNGVSMLLGIIFGAAAGAGITYAVLNKRHEKEMNEFVEEIRKEYAEQMDLIVKNIHKDDPGTIRKRNNQKKEEQLTDEELRKREHEEIQYFKEYIKKYDTKTKDEPEDVEVFDEPDGPGPDPNDPDALYPITESELIRYIEEGHDPEDLLLSADGELHNMNYTPFDSPYIFDGIDIESMFGKYNPDPSYAYFRDPVFKINYRVIKSLKTDDEMEKLARKGTE